MDMDIIVQGSIHMDMKLPLQQTTPSAACCNKEQCGLLAYCLPAEAPSIHSFSSSGSSCVILYSSMTETTVFNSLTYSINLS